MKKMVDGIEMDCSPADLEQMAIDEAQHAEEMILWNAEQYKRDREKAYNDVLGSAFEQIDYLCKNGLEALATSRQSIKDRFPKPTS